jgi:hypothetical protein
MTQDELHEAVINLPPDHPFNIWLDEQLAEVAADLERQKQEQKEQT